MPSTGRTLRGLTLLIALLILAGCGGDDDRLAALVPKLDSATATLLDTGRVQDLERFTATVSGDRLVDIRGWLETARYGVDRPLGAESQALLSRALATVDSILAVDLGRSEYAVETGFLAAMPPERAEAALERQQRFAAIFADTDVSAEWRLATLDSMQAVMLDDGDVEGALWASGILATLRHRQGNWDEALAMQRQAWHYAGHHHRLTEQCRTWTQLMQYAMRRGWSPAERDTTRLLVEQARDSRLAATASMLMSLQAYGATSQGRYSTARILFEDGVALCKDLGEHKRARLSYDFLLRMYAALECWNQVDKHLVVAEQLDAEYSKPGGGRTAKDLGKVRHEILAARSLAAQGQADAAHHAFARAFDTSTRLAVAEVGYYGQQWIDAMIANERADLADSAVTVVGEHARQRSTRHVLQRLPYWEAWLAWKSGDDAAALALLDTFDAAGSADRMVRDNLGLRATALRACAEKSRDPATAARILARGWSDLFGRIQEGEAGPEAYLNLGRNSHLRYAAHALLGEDPATAYGLELLWRRTMLPRWPTPENPAGRDLEVAARRLADHAMAELARQDAVHCLYQVRRDRVVRWTADGHGVVRDELGVGPQELRTTVMEVLERLGTDPGSADATVPAALSAELEELARLVLPARLFDPAGRPRTLLVSGESFLAQVPFTPLNLGTADAYLPLVEVMDVAWTRGGPGAAPVPEAASATSLIVASPTLDPTTRRRFQLPEGLPGAEVEAVAVAQWIPSPELVSGDAATPERVLAGWSDASVLYFLGHAVRDAEVPLTSWLPLAATESSGAYPGLDLKDIVSAHLDRCRLVVLSGCATGAPYVDGLSTTPSLGDAFLDAGAAAAIQTFWRVRDEGGVIRPDRILAAWRQDGRSLAAAVAEEQRRNLQGPDGYRHPFGWGAWTLKERGF